MSHDLFLPLPFALAVARWRVKGSADHGSALLAAGGLVYLAAAAMLRSGSDIAYGLGPHVFTNLAQFLACLIAPLSSVAELRSVASGIGLSATIQRFLEPSILIVGSGVLAALAVSAIRGDRFERAILFVGFSLLALPVLVRSHLSWIDPRYAYPAAAFLVPLLVARLFDLGRLWRSAPYLAVAIGIFWVVGLYTANVSMQKQALQESRGPRAERRWVQLQAVQASQDR